METNYFYSHFNHTNSLCCSAAVFRVLYLAAGVWWGLQSFISGWGSSTGTTGVSVITLLTGHILGPVVPVWSSTNPAVRLHAHTHTHTHTAVWTVLTLCIKNTGSRSVFTVSPNDGRDKMPIQMTHGEHSVIVYCQNDSTILSLQSCPCKSLTHASKW